MNKQRRIDEDDAVIGPAPWAAPEPEPAPAAKASRTKASTPASQPEPRRRSMAGRLLGLLLVLLAGAAAGLIGGPRLAPMLPAPLATWLAPASQGVSPQTLAALEERVLAQVSALGRDVETAAQAARAAQETAEAAREAALPAITPAEAAAADPALLDRMDAMQADIEALGQALLQAASQAGGLSDVALAEFDQRVDALAAAVAAVSAAGSVGATGDPAAVAALEQRLAALEADLVRDADIRERALLEAGDARRAAVVTTALADIDRAMAMGLTFAGALDALEAAADMAMPAALANAAAAGVATREALVASFNPAAHEAVAAALVAEGDDGMTSVLARVQARFTGIPSTPEPGPGTPSVLSRARHALLLGRLDMTLEELEALPETARMAMATWIEQAQVRHEADQALSDLRASLAGRF